MPSTAVLERKKQMVADLLQRAGHSCWRRYTASLPMAWLGFCT